MRALNFSRRTAKEILRDPLNILFGLGFPLVILVLLTAIQKNVPVPLFTPESLTPGVAVFGHVFLALFAATLIARDRAGYILGYALPLVPMALGQSLVTYGAALALGLKGTVNILWACLAGLPAAFFFIGLGLLCGTVFTDKQVGGLCGALLTNLTAWLSGTWFDVSLVGGWFKSLAEKLPFLHAVELCRAGLRGDMAGAIPHLWWVLGYMAAAIAAAVAVFALKMRKN